MEKVGERWARNLDGSTEKVPADMSFEEWRGTFVKQGQSAGDETQQTPGEIIQLGSVDFSDKRAVLDQLKLAQADFAGLDHEMNCTVTSDGKVWRVTGTKGQVNPWDIEKMGSSLKGSYSYHNHPAAQTWYSFSAADVRFFFAAGEECAMASDDVYEYVMRRTKNTVEISPGGVYSRFNEIRSKEIFSMMWDGLIDPDMDEFHSVMEILSRELKFDYARKTKAQS